MKYVLKINFLKNILIIALIIALGLPICVRVFIYPAFTDLLTKSTEDDAIRVARHLKSMIISEQNELTKASLPAELSNRIHEITKDFMLMKLKIFSDSGETVYSTTPKDIGMINKNKYFHDIVAKGKVYTKVVKKNTKSLENQIVTADVIETYIPIIKNDKFIGAFEIYYDITAIKEQLDKLLSTSSVALFILSISLMSAIIVVLIKAGKNIIERERTEQALQDSEKQYRMLFEKAGDAIFILEAEGEEAGKIVAANQAAAEMHGYTREELLVLNIKDLDTPDVAQKAQGRVKRILDGVWLKAEIAHRRKDGTEFPVEMSAGLLEIGDRKYILAFDRDIEDRKRAEEALKESNERIETILFSLPIGIVIIDSETHEIVDANPQAILMTGAPLEQIVGSKCHQFICPAEEGKCPVTDLGQTIDRSERMLVAANGERVPIYKSIIPLTLGERKCFIECFIDISEQKLAEQERIKKEKLEGIIEMSGAVCHEMNQPLMVISGRLELISMNLSKDDPLYEKISQIKEQCYRLGEITQKLMGITRYETKEYLEGKIIDIDKATE